MSDEQSGTDQKHHDIFISYAHPDKLIADAVCAKLESRNIRCWIAPRDVPPGKNFPEAIIDGIDGGKVMVVIFSSHANNSPHVIRELTNAVNKGRIIIPFRIEDVLPSKSMEYLISLPHWLDAVTPPLESHIEVLAKTLECIIRPEKTWADCPERTTAGEVQSQPAEPPTPPAPPPVPEPVIIQTPQDPAVVPALPAKTLAIAGIILVALIVIFLVIQAGVFSLPVQFPGPGLQDIMGTIKPTPSETVDYRSSDAIVNTVVLTVVPTQTLAKDTEVFVEVNKESSNAMVTILFAGGPGMGLVRSNRVILTRSDGTVTEGTLNFNQRQSEVQLQGSRGTDRLQVIITLFSGETKNIVDTLLPYRYYH
jgi:hypothetical protein